MLFRTATFATVLVTALTLFSSVSPPVAEAHSWAACINWKFNSSGREDWSEKGGKCYGYARRYPWKGKKDFADLDDDDPSRHYRQDGNPNKAPPCSDGENGKEVGADETRGNPISEAYDSKEGYGPMTIISAGEQLCVRWPAKNHAEGNEKDTKVQINLSSKPNAKDPSQEELLKNKIAELRYKNCGKASSTDKRPCGGCFEVPKRSPGTYLLQWRWELNKGEWYTSCADIQIK